MNRPQLQRLAQIRLEDAEALLQASRWSAAYYLAGYAVECALKSCVLKHIEDTGEIFSDKKYLNKLADCWTHNFVSLLDLANLTAIHGAAVGANPVFGAFWAVTKEWKESTRYREKTEPEARALYEAISHNSDGVFVWIQQRW